MFCHTPGRHYIVGLLCPLVVFFFVFLRSASLGVSLFAQVPFFFTGDFGVSGVNLLDEFGRCIVFWERRRVGNVSTPSPPI